MSRLLTAVKGRDLDTVEKEMRGVESRASALRTLASSCADRTRNLEGVRCLQNYTQMIFLNRNVQVYLARETPVPGLRLTLQVVRLG